MRRAAAAVLVGALAGAGCAPNKFESIGECHVQAMKLYPDAAMPMNPQVIQFGEFVLACMASRGFAFKKEAAGCPAPYGDQRVEECWERKR